MSRFKQYMTIIQEGSEKYISIGNVEEEPMKIDDIKKLVNALNELFAHKQNDKFKLNINGNEIKGSYIKTGEVTMVSKNDKLMFKTPGALDRTNFSKFLKNALNEKKNINEGIISNVIDKVFTGGQKRFEEYIKPKLDKKKEITLFLSELYNYNGLKEKICDMEFIEEKMSKNGFFPKLDIDRHLKNNFIKLFIGKKPDEINRIYKIEIFYNENKIKRYEDSVKKLQTMHHSDPDYDQKKLNEDVHIARTSFLASFLQNTKIQINKNF